MFKYMYWVVQCFCEICVCLELQNEMLCGNGVSLEVMSEDQLLLE